MRPTADITAIQQAKYLEHGRNAARIFLDTGRPSKPPKGVSYLTILRGYSDVLSMALLYKIECFLKKEDVPMKDLLEALRVTTSLAMRVRMKPPRKYDYKGGAVPPPPPSRDNPLPDLSEEEATRFDQESGLVEKPQPPERVAPDMEV